MKKSLLILLCLFSITPFAYSEEIIDKIIDKIIDYDIAQKSLLINDMKALLMAADVTAEDGNFYMIKRDILKRDIALLIFIKETDKKEVRARTASNIATKYIEIYTYETAFKKEFDGDKALNDSEIVYIQDQLQLMKEYQDKL